MNFAIDPNAVYLTPTGRRCKWVPLGGARGVWTSSAHFCYLNDHHALADGFTLTPQNYKILRKEATHAPSR